MLILYLIFVGFIAKQSYNLLFNCSNLLQNKFNLTNNWIVQIGESKFCSQTLETK